MALKEVKIGEDTIWIEVAELEVEGDAAGGAGGVRREYTSVPGVVKDLPEYIRKTVEIMTKPVRTAFEGTGAEEWSMELNIGFKGGSAIPFVANGEANAAIKVTAKWKK